MRERTKVHLIKKLKTLISEIEDYGDDKKRIKAAKQFNKLLAEVDGNVLRKLLINYSYMNVFKHGFNSEENRNIQIFRIRAIGVFGDKFSSSDLCPPLRYHNRRIRKEAVKALYQLANRNILTFEAVNNIISEQSKILHENKGMIPLWLLGPIDVLHKKMIDLLVHAFFFKRWMFKWKLVSAIYQIGVKLLPASKFISLTLGSFAIPPFGVVYITKVQSHREKIFNGPWMEAGRPMTGRQRFFLITTMLGIVFLSILVNEFWTLQLALIFLSVILIICFIVWLGMELSRKDRYFHGSEWLDEHVSMITQTWLLLGRPFCWIGIHSWDWDAISTARSGIVSPHSRECKRCQYIQRAVLIYGRGVIYKKYEWSGEKWQ